MAKKSNIKQKGSDLISLILEDHKPLKKLIKIMKDSDKSLKARKAAFEEFGPALATHAAPEEQVLYVWMKENKDLREDGFEGDVEHGLADQMLEEAKRTDDVDLWSARVKVLAELVEHHIKEEEEDMLPEFKKASDKNERIEMGQDYLDRKENTREDGQEKISSRAKPTAIHAHQPQH